MSDVFTQRPVTKELAPARSAGDGELHVGSASRADAMEAAPEQWRSVKTVIVLAWLYSLLPSLAGVVHTGRGLASTLSLSAPPSAIGSALGTTLSTLIIAMCGLVVLGRRPPRRRRGPGAFAVLALPWMTVIVTNVVAGQGLSRQVVLYPLLALMIWLEAPPVDVLKILAPLVVATAVISLLMILVLPRVAYYANPGGLAQVDKSILGGRLLAGPYSHPNLLGAVLALGSPSLLLIENRRWRLVCLFVVAATCLATSSRTSVVATAAVLVIYVVAARRPAWVGRTAGFLSVLGAGLLLLTPLLTTDPRAFSLRGQIWLGSLSSWRTHPLAGLGTDFFQRIGQESNNLGPYAFTGHNLLVDTLTKAGLAGLFALLFVCWWTSRAAWSGATGTVVGVAYVAAFVFENWLEARVDLLNLGQLGYIVWLPVMVLISATSPGTATRLTKPRASQP